MLTGIHSAASTSSATTSGNHAQDSDSYEQNAQVKAAFIDPFSIEGKVSLNEVTFSISSSNPAIDSIFGKTSDSTEPFEVALSLSLPKGVNELKETKHPCKIKLKNVAL